MRFHAESVRLEPPTQPQHLHWSYSSWRDRRSRNTSSPWRAQAQPQHLQPLTCAGAAVTSRAADVHWRSRNTSSPWYAQAQPQHLQPLTCAGATVTSTAADVHWRRRNTYRPWRAQAQPQHLQLLTCAYTAAARPWILHDIAKWAQR